jgi:small conductance mechanosensitive channel
MFPNLVLAVLIILVFILLANLIKKLFGNTITRFSQNIAVNELLSNVIYLAVITIGIFAALSVLQLSKAVTSLLAGVGVVGLALGFAFQNTAANLISGIFMATRHPINVGDLVETDGYFGRVETIDMRFTNIKQPQGQSVIIPNRTILQSPLVNYTVNGERRIDLECGISYGEDLEKVRKVAILAVEENVKYDSNRPVEFMYREFGDSSINFVLRFWINQTMSSIIIPPSAKAARRSQPRIS